MALKFMQYGCERLKSAVAITSMVQRCNVLSSKVQHHRNILATTGLRKPLCNNFHRSLHSYATTSLCYGRNICDNNNSITKSNQQNGLSCNKVLLEPNLVLQMTKRNAGHSQFQNIRHRKAETDGVKSKNGRYIYHKMKNAVKVGGKITDPKLNSKLANVIEEGRRLCVPNAKMQEYIKKITKNQGVDSIYYFEGKGPGNVLFIFRVVTDSPKTIKNSLKGIYRKIGGVVGDKSGFASYGFDFKGMVFVPKEGISDLEAAMDIAIESGAEEVIEITGDDGSPEYQFICDATELLQVLGKIKKHDINVKDYYETYIPKELVTVNQDVQDLLSKFYDKLEVHFEDDIEQIYDNIKVDED